MQVVIPIAGKGKRMAGAYQGPKQLLPVAGRPLVEYALAAVPASVDELVLVVGGPHEQAIRAYFGREHGGRRVTMVRQEEQRGLGHALQRARGVVRGRFLTVLPDDLYAPEDLSGLQGEADLGALAAHVANPAQFGVFVCDAEGCLVRAVEKPKEFISNLTSTGAYLLDEEFFDVSVPPSGRGEIELPDLVLALVRERGRRVRVREATFWHPVNDPEQLSEAEREVMQRLNLSSPATLHAAPSAR